MDLIEGVAKQNDLINQKRSFAFAQFILLLGTKQNKISKSVDSNTLNVPAPEVNEIVLNLSIILTRLKVYSNAYSPKKFEQYLDGQRSIVKSIEQLQLGDRQRSLVYLIFVP